MSYVTDYYRATGELDRAALEACAGALATSEHREFYLLKRDVLEHIIIFIYKRYEININYDVAKKIKLTLKYLYAGSSDEDRKIYQYKKRTNQYDDL